MAEGCAYVQELCPRGVRLVRLLPGDVGSVDELGRALGQHPRVRFVVVCYPFELSATTAAAVVPALSGLHRHLTCAWVTWTPKLGGATLY